MGKKRIAVFLAFVMALSVVLGQLTPYITTKAAGSTLIIHYGGREDGNYDGWNLWVWEEGKDGKQVDFKAEDDFGKIAVTSISKPGKVGFIVRLNEWEAKDIETDRFVEVGDGVTEIWLTSGKEKIAETAPEGASTYDFEQEAKKLQAIYNKKGALKVNVHFYDFKKKYKNVSAYAWIGEEDGANYQVQKKDKFGAVFQIGFMNKKKAKTMGLKITMPDGAQDCESIRMIDLTQAKKNKLDIYIVEGNKEVYYNKKDAVKDPVISNASFVSGNEITFAIADTMDTSKEDLVKKFKVVDQDSNEYDLVKIWSANPGVEQSASVILAEEVDFSNSYTLYMDNHVSLPISVSDAFSTEEFEEAYSYEGSDLGATYTKEKTSFRVWAPTASEVSINFYQEGSGDNLTGTEAMLKDEKGTWVYEASGDMKNTYYTYSVTVEGVTTEAVDPYTRTTGVNGQRGMVVDLEATNPEGFDKDKRPEYDTATEAVIYELQIRDLSSDSSSGIKNTGKYLGLTEEGTKNADGLSTGLDHMKELGITHLHIMPSFDYASVDESDTGSEQYNWGYDPQNYNVPEGSYATDATDGNVRVNEYKQMVQSLHENGIRVVMDVVYNHTFNIEDSNFQKIVPDYYYRKSGDSYTNGSGCGNETASERAMMRKYIVDSVVYWATEYHVDGFRFDLMGVHDIETMNAVREALDEIDPSILVYGEGWTGGDSALDESERVTKANISKVQGVAAFSDDFRDGLKGNVFDEFDTGFITGNDTYLEDVKLGIVAATDNEQIDKTKLTKSEGAWASEPDQCINYASCHDNLTLWDKISTSMPDASEEDKVRMNKLAAAMTFTSQGIPFIMAGEELLRSKPSATGDGTYDANSYCSPDTTNSIKWDTKTNNKEIFEYYKGLIAFRKVHGALRMTSTEDIQKNLTFLDKVKGNAIAYTIKNSPNGDNAEEIMVIHNGNDKAITVSLPDDEKWSVYINGEKAGTEVIEEISGDVSVEKLSTMVLVKESGTAKLINAAKQVDSRIYIGIGIVVVLLSIVLGVVIWKRKQKKKRNELHF